MVLGVRPAYRCHVVNHTYGIAACNTDIDVLTDEIWKQTADGNNIWFVCVLQIISSIFIRIKYISNAILMDIALINVYYYSLLWNILSNSVITSVIRSKMEVIVNS